MSICSAVREGAARAWDKNQNIGSRSISGEIIQMRRANWNIWEIMPRHSLLLQRSDTEPGRRIHQINHPAPDPSDMRSNLDEKSTSLLRVNTWNTYHTEPKMPIKKLRNFAVSFHQDPRPEKPFQSWAIAVPQWTTLRRQLFTKTYNLYFPA